MGLTGLFSFSASVCGCGGGLVVAAVAAAPHFLLVLHLPEMHLPLVIKVFDSICLLLSLMSTCAPPAPGAGAQLNGLYFSKPEMSAEPVTGNIAYKHVVGLCAPAAAAWRNGNAAAPLALPPNPR